eukprot:1159067-Pelagomonas_calceolata.AAC.19
MGYRGECASFDLKVFRTNGGNLPLVVSYHGRQAVTSSHCLPVHFSGNEGIRFPPKLLSVPQIPYKILHGNLRSTQHFLFKHILIAHATKCLRHVQTAHGRSDQQEPSY